MICLDMTFYIKQNKSVKYHISGAIVCFPYTGQLHQQDVNGPRDNNVVNIVQRFVLFLQNS